MNGRVMWKNLSKALGSCRGMVLRKIPPTCKHGENPAVSRRPGVIPESVGMDNSPLGMYPVLPGLSQSFPKTVYFKQGYDYER